MTEKEYAELMSFFKHKLKHHPETGLSGNRAEGYQRGIQVAMSKISSMYKKNKEDNK